MCTVFVCGGVFLLSVCGDVFLACSTGRTPNLLPLFHLRRHVSSFAAGQGESSERTCNSLCVECLSADHKSQRAQSLQNSQLGKNHMVCGAHILSYWCPEQRRFRRSRVVRWPRVVFDILFNQHVSERGRAALSPCFLIFCSPQFILNYSSVSKPPPEYTAVFVVNIVTLLLFVLVFVYDFFCALRRRVVAFRHGESEAMRLHPRWFSTYRCTRLSEFFQILAFMSQCGAG